MIKEQEEWTFFKIWLNRNKAGIFISSFLKPENWVLICSNHKEMDYISVMPDSSSLPPFHSLYFMDHPPLGFASFCDIGILLVHKQ